MIISEQFLHVYFSVNILYSFALILALHSFIQDHLVDECLRGLMMERQHRGHKETDITVVE